MKLLLLFSTITGLFTLGCNYKLPETSTTESNVNASVSQSNQTSDAANSSVNAENSKSEIINSSEPLVLSGTSESATLPCGGREVEVVKDATANSYNLTGECKKLTVDGVSNKITIEKVGEIVVTGISNKVAYGAGLGGGKPKIKTSGTSTSVDSLKSLEEKKAAENK